MANSVNWPDIPIGAESPTHDTLRGSQQPMDRGGYGSERGGYGSPDGYSHSRTGSFFEEGGKSSPPRHMHEHDTIYEQDYNAEAASTYEESLANESHYKPGGDDLVKKLVRLNTTLRRQLHNEGWDPSSTDGVLTEDELLEIARSQGLLKRQAKQWKLAAFGSLGLVAASFGVMLGLVMLGLILTKQTRVDGRDGILRTMNSGYIIQAVRAEEGFPITRWASVGTTELLHINRLMLASSDGAISNMQVDTVLADYSSKSVLFKSADNGWVYVTNQTIAAVQINNLLWTPGAKQWEQVGSGAKRRRLLQVVNATVPEITMMGNAIFFKPAFTAIPDLLVSCPNITGLPGCPRR
eukprot:jgi/Mesen1/3741/ME000204S03001